MSNIGTTLMRISRPSKVLSKIGRSKTKPWEDRFRILSEALAKYQEWPSQKNNPSLYNWLIYQRKLNRDNKLPPHRVELLNKLNFPWKGSLSGMPYDGSHDLTDQSLAVDSDDLWDCNAEIVFDAQVLRDPSDDQNIEDPKSEKQSGSRVATINVVLNNKNIEKITRWYLLGAVVDGNGPIDQNPGAKRLVQLCMKKYK